MRTAVCQILAGVAVLLLVAGCSPSGRQDTAKDAKAAGTRLRSEEVIRIAGDAAIKKGYHLSDYKAPQARYEFLRKDKTWSVFFDGKIPMPGRHFLVWVNDKTGVAQVMTGE